MRNCLAVARHKVQTGARGESLKKVFDHVVGNCAFWRAADAGSLERKKQQ